MKILVTGGAGFIGSHLVDELLTLGHKVVVYDNLDQQVHGDLLKPPEYLAKDIEFIQKDIRDKDALLSLLNDIDVIYHLAANVGVGQSMYQIDKYVDVNILGTARLLDLLVNKPNNVKKLIVTTSMSVYGEGSYICENCNDVIPKSRDLTQLQNRNWDLNCPLCGNKVKPVPTTEDKPQECNSIYALTKQQQEKMCLLVGDIYGFNTTALRIFNTYGSRQALSNPYTGVCANFSSRLLSNKSPIIYEDGNQTRDFVYVKDVCKALILCLEKNQAKNEVFNVGSGNPISILQIAEILIKKINRKITPTLTNRYRPGDIRHCYADISKISLKLGYKPKYSFEDGIEELIEWVRFQKGKTKDNSSKANNELKKKGFLQ